MVKIAIIGKNSKIAQVISNKLVEGGHDLTFVERDLSISEDVEYVINFAGEIRNECNFYSANVHVLKRIIDTATSSQLIVNLSSLSMYETDILDSQQIDINSFSPASSYGLSKAWGHQIVSNSDNGFNLIIGSVQDVRQQPKQKLMTNLFKYGLLEGKSSAGYTYVTYPQDIFDEIVSIINDNTLKRNRFVFKNYHHSTNTYRWVFTKYSDLLIRKILSKFAPRIYKTIFKTIFQRCEME